MEQNIYKREPLGVNGNGTPFKAVIVDDSALARQILRQSLLSVGFNIIDEISNGQLAVQKLTSGNLIPDYLFVDMEMPGLNGGDVIKKVKPDIPKCKIIIVTSHSEKDIVQEIITLGVDGYIKKPYNRDTVLKNLEKLKYG
ncbi:MAG: response regulator [Spirochaetes bacterium]|nr:response regulator [Spirochaetota bacterium]